MAGAQQWTKALCIKSRTPTPCRMSLPVSADQSAPSSPFDGWLDECRNNHWARDQGLREPRWTQAGFLYFWCHGNRWPRARWRSVLWLKRNNGFILPSEGGDGVFVPPSLHKTKKRCTIRVLYWNWLISFAESTLIHLLTHTRTTRVLIWWGVRLTPVLHVVHYWIAQINIL